MALVPPPHGPLGPPKPEVPDVAKLLQLEVNMIFHRRFQIWKARLSWLLGFVFFWRKEKEPVHDKKKLEDVFAAMSKHLGPEADLMKDPSKAIALLKQKQAERRGSSALDKAKLALASDVLPQADDNILRKALGALPLPRLSIIGIPGIGGDQPAAAPPPQRKPTSKRKPWMTLPKATYYMRYATAAYGFGFFLMDSVPFGPHQAVLYAWQIAKFLYWRICNKLWGVPSPIHGDWLIQKNAITIVVRTGINPADFVYVNFHDGVSETPHYVTLDHNAKAIVIAVRGTFSLRDAITDAIAFPEHIKEINDKFPDAECHSGMLHAARYILGKLNDNKVIETALQRAPDYQLVVCGHSLGAGTAAILALILKQKYPNLICFAFEPPGWLVTKEISQYMADFCLSLVTGNDLVPRIGIVTLKKLVGQMVHVVKEATNPESSAVPQEEAEASVKVPLYMPGRVLYLQEAVRGGMLKKAKYIPKWAKPEMFDEIIVDDNIIHDHMADFVLEQLGNTGAAVAGGFVRPVTEEGGVPGSAPPPQ